MRTSHSYNHRHCRARVLSSMSAKVHGTFVFFSQTFLSFSSIALTKLWVNFAQVAPVNASFSHKFAPFLCLLANTMLHSFLSPLFIFLAVSVVESCFSRAFDALFMFVQTNAFYLVGECSQWDFCLLSLLTNQDSHCWQCLAAVSQIVAN